jgi:hypothetical protein
MPYKFTQIDLTTIVTHKLVAFLSKLLLLEGVEKSLVTGDTIIELGSGDGTLALCLY